MDKMQKDRRSSNLSKLSSTCKSAREFFYLAMQREREAFNSMQQQQTKKCTTFQMLFQKAFNYPRNKSDRLGGPAPGVNILARYGAKNFRVEASMP